MRARQKQAIEAYQRVQDFLGDHPPPESPGYLAQKRALDDVVESLDDHAMNQVAGRRLRFAETPRQRALRRELRERHLRPISNIARAILADAPGIERALRMPGYRISPMKLVAEANAMRSAAELYEEQFVKAGRPADFLARLDAAAEALRQSVLGKARYLGRHVGACAGLAAEITRGRRVVELLDAIVRDAFWDDQEVLAKWRSARRVRAVPGGVGSHTAERDGSDAAPNVAPMALVSASAA